MDLDSQDSRLSHKLLTVVRKLQAIAWKVVCRLSRSRVTPFLGLLIFLAGIYRLSINPSIPSYRLIEIGTLLLIYRFLPVGRLGLNKIPEKLFIVAIVATAFVFRVFPNVIYPLPVGYDPPLYLYAAKYLSQNPHEILTTLILHSEPAPWYFWWEPLPPLLFASFALTGLPLLWIAIVLVPAISAITLVPIYFLTSVAKGKSVAILTALFLMFDPIQLRLSTDYYRNVVGNLFLFAALYFLMKEEKLSAKAVVMTALLMASHLYSLPVLATTLLLFQKSCGHLSRERIRLYALTFALAFLLSLCPIWLFLAWTEFSYQMTKQQGGLLSFLYWVSVQTSPLDYLSRRMWGEVLSPLIWTMGITIASIPTLVKGSKRSLPFALLFSVVILTILGFFEVFGEIKRWIFYLEFPLAMLAAISVQDSRRQKYLTPLILGIIFVDGITFASQLLRVEQWQYEGRYTWKQVFDP